MLALQRASVAVAAVVGGGTMVTDSPEHLIERWWAPAAAVCNFCRLVSPSDRHLTWRADVCECHMVQVATACAARLHRLRQSNALSARHEHRQRVAGFASVAGVLGAFGSGVVCAVRLWATRRLEAAEHTTA